jgi:DNA-directed RNA polymerase sigma subunit (sigma70/sigma32)
VTGEATTEEAVARHLGWPEQAVHRVRAVSIRLVQIAPDRKESDENKNSSVAVLSSSSPTPEDCLIQTDLSLVMQKCIEGIRESRDRIILICRLVHRLELKMLARVMGFSIEGIRQKEIRAKNQMKQCLQSAGWDEYSLK